MAIYIDIIARLNQQRLIKQGEDLRKYINGLEDEISDHRLRVARAESTKLIKFDDNVATSRDQLINKTDELTAARLRLKAADKSVRETETRTLKTDEDVAKQKKDNTAALKEQAAATQDLVYKLQAENRALRVNELAKRVLNEETKAHAKNLRDVADITDKNRGKFIRLSMVTNRLRRDVENLHTANITTLQDNSKANKSMEGLSESIKKTAREREKYNDVLLSKNPARIKAQGLVVERAMEAEARKAQDVQDVLVGLIEQRREHDSVVNQSETSLRGLANQSLQLEKRAIDLRSANRDVIDQNITLTRQFDRHSNSVLKVSNEYRKYHDMSQDVSVGSDALANQIENINKAVVEQQRALRDASYALDDYYKRQEDGERRAQEAARKKAEQDAKRLRPQSMGQYFSRNLGALTPLGTLSPSTLLPLAGVLGSIGEAAVTASQSLALLPAAGVAAAAGIGTLAVGMRGFGDALSGMGDPKKFAEALYLLSPNAQQAALSIKSLVDGPLGDLKRATQDALFADVGVTIQKLTDTFGPAIQRMTTSIATSFNQMFTGISFEMMTPEMAERVEVITTNISSMFKLLEPAISQFNSAFIKIVQTGSGFLPGLADSLTSVMTTFNAFITRAQEDGSLQNFVSKGIDAVKALSKWLLGFGQDIYEVFGNKSPEEFMNTLDGVKAVLIGLGKLFVAVAGFINEWGPAIGNVVDSLGGFENVLYTLVGFGFAGWLVKMVKLFKDLKGILGLIGPAGMTAAKGIGAASTAGAMAAGGAATTAAAKQTAATTAATFATAGKTAAKGFGAQLIAGLRGLAWPSVGLMIAAPILNSLDDAFNEWIASKQDNPQAYTDNRNAAKEENIFPSWVPFLSTYENWIRQGPSALNPFAETPQAPGPPPNKDSFFEDWYPAGADPAGPMSDMPSGYDFPLPNVQIDPETGKALTDSELLNKIRGELLPDSYAVDPFTDPITGQKLNPMLPMGPNGLPEYPAGGVPGTPSIQGPVMPQYNSFGQKTGYGASMVDPEEVFDAQLAVVDRARDLEEANKDVLAAKQAGILSAEEINDLERKVIDDKLSLHKALVQLGKAQTGDVEKLKTATGNAADMLGDFGASLDKDFGISKGLSGIAENLTKFLANLAFAPAYGAMRGAQAALGFPGGEGTGHGLAGAMAASRGYYKGGPMDTGGQQGSGYAPSSYAPSFQVGPQSAGVGYGSGPDMPGVTKGDLKGINLATIPVAAQKYANNCINAAAQIVLSADGVSLTQDALDQTIKRGGSIQSLAAGLNKLNPSGGYVPIEGSGGSPEALYAAVQDSINKGLGAVLNVAPDTEPGGGKIAGRSYAPGHFIAITGYDPNSGRINLSDTGDGSMYSVTAAEAFQSSKGRGLVAGTGVPAVPRPPVRPGGPTFGPPSSLPGFATGGEVPIMAHSGEHVLTREDVAALGGQSGVYGFRRSLHSYNVGGAVPRAPFSPDPFDPSNVALPAPKPVTPVTPQGEVIRPTDLGSLLGVGDSMPAAPAPKVPTVPVPAVPAPTVPEITVVPAPAVPTLPETVLPSGTETPGSVIGAQAEAPAGYGGGFDITGGGLVGLAQQGLMAAATSGAGMAGAGAAMGGGGGGGMGAGSGAASAIASLGMETAIKLGQRGIEYGAEVAGIATQGLLETFLPAGGSELASNNWLTRLVGGIAGAAPAMANLAGGKNQSMLPGVGGPPTPEQIAAQGMDPNRAQHTGAGAPAGPVNNIGVQIMEYRTEDNRPASQDFGRYAVPGQR